MVTILNLEYIISSPLPNHELEFDVNQLIATSSYVP